MQFLIIARDFEDALERRLNCRALHIELIDKLKTKGHFLYGGAFLDEQEKMVGSFLICDFPSREDLETQWLQHEPYMTEKVWESVEIQQYRVGPSFIENAFSNRDSVRVAIP